MMEVLSDESDDEVFIGKLSLKEIKKRLLGNKNHEVQRCEVIVKEIKNLKIIEMHSEPNLSCCDKKTSSHQRAVSIPALIITPSTPSTVWDLNQSDDSFELIERNASCKEGKTVDSDNIFSVFNDVLKNKQAQNYENCSSTEQGVINYTCTGPCAVVPESTYICPVKSRNKIDAIVSSSETCGTPIKIRSKENDAITPVPDAKTNTHVFRTPGIPAAHRRTPASIMKSTPSKTNKYEHIVSPVASYINNSPIVPLFKNVRPTKPLPGPSAIPKLKSIHNKIHNKENLNLPTIAYKTAKITKVLDVANEEKLPQSQWAKKISSSLPRPLVMKHHHRDIKFSTRTLMSQQEDSFGDLPLQQADLSVCTQKSAFNTPKKAL